MMEQKPKKRNWLLIGCGGTFALLVVCGLIGMLAGNNPARQQSTGAPTAVSQSNAASIATAAVEEPQVESAPTEAPAPEPTTAPEPTAMPEPTVAPTAPPAAPKIGEDVKVGEIRWKITEATDLGQELKAENDIIDPKKTAGKWIRVKYEIENQSKDPKSFTGIDVTDSQGRKFQAATAVFGFIPNEELCSLQQLPANVPKTCTSLFELPADAAGLRLIVGDLELFGADEAQIDLGL